MRTLDHDLGVWEIARNLGYSETRRPSENVVEHCRGLVEGWVEQEGGIGCIGELEGLVCRRLNLDIQEFQHEFELQELVRGRVSEGDVVFASLPALFDEETYATLIRRRQPTAEGAPAYTAVIDCRGGKSRRRWFSRWHEIAHLLTQTTPAGQEPVHRSTTASSPVERLMDLVAAEVGFFDPLFRPIHEKELLSTGRLDFGAIERVRASYAPEASFQATAIACIKRWPAPAVLLEAGLALTAAEERLFDAEPVPSRRPVPRLRVLKVSGNTAAEAAGLLKLRRMQVPAQSLLHELFFAKEGATGPALASEDLEQWRRSSGRSLAPLKISVEARPGRHHLEAIIQAI